MNTELQDQIPYVDFGGKGDIIHFAHANGFPPKTYSSLICHLTKNHHVIGMDLRPLWPNSDYRDFRSWETGADDIIQFLDDQNLSGIIGIGHSFGAIATTIAAAKRPDLFKKIVLIEPVVLPDWIYWMTKLVPKFILKKINPVAKKTFERTEQWEDRNKTFQQFRKKEVFAKIADDQLWDYVNAATTKNSDGTVSLRYSKEWEAHIYMTLSPSWKYFDQLTTQHLILRGETSDAIMDDVWENWKSKNEYGRRHQVAEFGHLLPLEAPQLTAQLIKDFLQDS